MCGVSSDTSGADTNGGTQHGEVDPLGNFPVRLHQASVDVFGVGESWFTADQILEAGNDFTTVVQSGVGNDGGAGPKVCTIDDHATRRKTGNTASTWKSDRKRKGTYYAGE